MSVGDCAMLTQSIDATQQLNAGVHSVQPKMQNNLEQNKGRREFCNNIIAVRNRNYDIFISFCWCRSYIYCQARCKSKHDCKAILKSEFSN